MNIKLSEKESKLIYKIVFGLTHDLIMQKPSYNIARQLYLDKLQLFEETRHKLHFLKAFLRTRDRRDYTVSYLSDIQPIFTDVEDRIRILEIQQPSGHSFDKEPLKDIIFPAYVDCFYDYEKQLIGKDFFDENCKWIESKHSLASLIIGLQELGYYRKRQKKLQDQSFRSLIRRFFEKRYSINISQQVKPSKGFLDINYRAYHATLPVPEK